jgi:hypothetical protein
VVKVTVYVEGGGEGRDVRIRCREGFSKLAASAGFTGRMPKFVACGSRNETFKKFRIAIGAEDEYSLLLVDSEDPVPTDNVTVDSPVAWDHLKTRDSWERPPGTANDQAQLMVTSVETWLMADKEALASVFGPQLNRSAVFSLPGLEARSRQDLLEALKAATEPCGPKKMYDRGPRSFEILARVSAAVLCEHLSYFARFVDTLDQKLV